MAKGHMGWRKGEMPQYVRDKISQTIKERWKNLTDEEKKNQTKGLNTPESILKSGEKRKGHIPWNKGKKGVMPVPWNKGKKLSKEFREKCRQRQLGVIPSEISRKRKSETFKKKYKNKAYRDKWYKSIPKGAEAFLWQGGISINPYPREFGNKLKEQIRGMDNYTCQQCGITQKQLGYSLHVHHIDFDKQNHNPKNLISLCRICHAQTRFNREDWIQYFQNKIELSQRG